MATRVFRGLRVLLPEWRVAMVRPSKPLPKNEAVFRVDLGYVGSAALQSASQVLAGGKRKTTPLALVLVVCVSICEQRAQSESKEKRESKSEEESERKKERRAGAGQNRIFGQKAASSFYE